MTPKIISRIMSVVTLMIVSITAFAQEQVEINGHDVGSWFSRNWMWITGGVILLLLIILFSRSSSKRRTTTVVKDPYGNVKSVTTTETRE
jgi:cytochrome bd-type quinol oxidase subunit 2